MFKTKVYNNLIVTAHKNKQDFGLCFENSKTGKQYKNFWFGLHKYFKFGIKTLPHFIYIDFGFLFITASL